MTRTQAKRDGCSGPQFRLSESARAGSVAVISKPCRQLSRLTSTCVSFRGEVAGMTRSRPWLDRAGHAGDFPRPGITGTPMLVH